MREPHPIGSRDTEKGFEYYCFTCQYLARWEAGKYSVVEEGDYSAHSGRQAKKAQAQEAKRRAKGR